VSDLKIVCPEPLPNLSTGRQVEKLMITITTKSQFEMRPKTSARAEDE
jgi:hypothetical protein